MMNFIKVCDHVRQLCHSIMIRNQPCGARSRRLLQGIIDMFLAETQRLRTPVHEIVDFLLCPLQETESDNVASVYRNTW